jgi:hypothetical protein
MRFARSAKILSPWCSVVLGVPRVKILHRCRRHRPCIEMDQCHRRVTRAMLRLDERTPPPYATDLPGHPIVTRRRPRRLAALSA